MTPSILFSLFILLIVLILCLIILISKVFYIQSELEHLSDLMENFKMPVPPPPVHVAPQKGAADSAPKHSEGSIRFATYPCPSCDYVHVINEQDFPVRKACPSCGQTVEIED